MDNFIDINIFDTYPDEFKQFIENNSKILVNTFKNKEICISVGSGLFDFLNEMMINYHVKCIHASRTYNKNEFYNKGLIVSGSSKELLDIILEPTKELLKADYECVYKQLKNKINDDKYKTLHFVIGNINDITISNGFWMLDNYGGELLADVLGYDNPIYKKISSIGFPVAVLFKLKFNKINDYVLSEIYSFMIKKAMYDENLHLFKETYIFENVPKENIIEVKGAPVRCLNI